MRNLFVAATLLAGIPGWSAAPASTGASGVRIDTHVGADSVTVGERLHIRYAAAYPESLTLLPPGRFDTGNGRLVSLQWSDGSPATGRLKQADLVVLPVDLEGARVPPLPFFFLSPGGDTLVASSREVDVPIRRLTGEATEQRPLKPQWEAPRSYWRYALAAGLVVLAVVAVWLWLRHRKKRTTVEAPRPELPPDYVALKALEEIESMRLLEEGQYKKYYTLVVDVVRRYFEKRFGILTMDRTTDEILRDLSALRPPVDGCEALLREADLVKFAKYRPDIEAGKNAIEAARDLVVRTAPRPLAAAVGGE